MFGFAGSIACPPAVKWCASEAVTGLTFVEQNGECGDRHEYTLLCVGPHWHLHRNLQWSPSTSSGPSCSV